jgi:GntR family transcriptional regulator/MocR family aminotransferase
LAAFEQLGGEGFLSSRHGSGTYLSEFPLTKQPNRSLNDGSGQCGTTADTTVVVDLEPGQPDVTRLVEAAWTRAWRSAARVVSGVGPPEQGLLELREQISAHLAAARGIAIDPSAIFVTAGTSDALALLTHALRLGGQTVAVEDPGYPTARRLLQRLGCTLVPVPVDDEGLVVSMLNSGPRAPRAVLVTPSHQYPLGGRLPIARRLALLEWAASAGSVIIEDDYDSEFRFDVAPIPALASLDRYGSVAHVGTFSKVLTPWLRAGYLAAPAQYLQALRDVRADLGSPVSGIDQQALAEYLDDGALRRHIARSRRRYAHARAHLRRRLALHEPTLGLRGIDAGLHAVIDLPPDTNVEDVLMLVHEFGFRLADLTEYRVDDRTPMPPAVVLGYGGATVRQLDGALAALAQAVHRQRPRQYDIAVGDGHPGPARP